MQLRSFALISNFSLARGSVCFTSLRINQISLFSLRCDFDRVTMTDMKGSLTSFMGHGQSLMACWVCSEQKDGKEKESPAWLRGAGRDIESVGAENA
jgi:hypothetical protein